MQVHQQGQLEEPSKNVGAYSLFEVEKNKIGEKGCRHFSKAIWRELEVIQLSSLPLT